MVSSSNSMSPGNSLDLERPWPEPGSSLGAPRRGARDTSAVTIGGHRAGRGGRVRRTRRHRVVRLSADGSSRARADVLAGEEPMELRVDGTPWTVTMRTPGEDFDLALGFLVSEGVVWQSGQVAEIGYGPGVSADGSSTYNVVEVRLAPGVAPPDTSHERHVYTSSSCGICGTASIDAVSRTARVPVADDDVRVPLAELLAMTGRLRDDQRLFSHTGGVHAASLFRLDDAG